MESAAVMPLSSAHETVTDKMRALLFSRCHALPSRVPQPSDACAARTARMCAENFGTNRSAMLSSSDTPGSTLPNTYRYFSAVMTTLQHWNHRITAANIAAAAAP